MLISVYVINASNCRPKLAFRLHKWLSAEEKTTILIFFAKRIYIIVIDIRRFKNDRCWKSAFFK